MVVKVNDFRQRQMLGTTSKAPRWAIAYKVELWQAVTRIEDIYVQVGKTGTLTPVATVTVSVSTEIGMTIRNGEDRLGVIVAVTRVSRKPSA